MTWMDENRDNAVKVLNQALGAIETGRAKHGSAQESFTMIGELWSVYLEHITSLRGGTKYTIMPDDVARMMSLLKIARATYSYDIDDYVDEAGYAALAYMLNPITQEKK